MATTDPVQSGPASRRFAVKRMWSDASAKHAPWQEGKITLCVRLHLIRHGSQSVMRDSSGETIESVEVFRGSGWSAKSLLVQPATTALTTAAMFAERVCAGGQRAYVDGVFETVHEEAVKRNG